MIAQAPDGEATVHRGGGDMEGGFVVADVPLVPYWLRVRNMFLAGVPGSAPFDLLGPTLGRLGAEAAPEGTLLQLGLVGLAPVQRTDRIYLFSADAGALFDHLTEVDTAPLVGATTWSGLLDARQFQANLIEGVTSGDETFVVQMVALPQSPTVRAARRAMRTTALEMTGGAMATLTAGLEEIATRESATIDWQRRQLVRTITDGRPEARPFRHDLTLQVNPGTVRHGWFSRGGDLLTWGEIEAADRPDAPVAMEWGNPFPGHWGRLLDYRTRFRVVLAPEPPLFWSISGAIGGTQLITPGATATVAARVGPPRDIRVAGRDPATAGDGVGLAPTISWSPPTLGTANGYTVTVWVLEEMGEASFRGELVVSGTEARLPPGLLDPGKWAAVTVRAVANELFGPRTPNRSVPGLAFADAVSWPFRP